MGNRGSTADRWDSSDEGGSDYEHKYDFHNSVLHKSPYDGFESDYDDDDYFPPNLQRNSPATAAEVDSNLAGPQVNNAGDAGVNATQRSKGQGQNDGKVLTGGGDGAQAGPVTVGLEHGTGVGMPSGALMPTPHTHTLQAQEAGNQKGVPQQGSQTSEKINQPSQSQSHDASASASASASAMRQESQETVHVDVEDVYETAGEGEEKDKGDAEASDDDSLSTITPPRTRPQSDSEYSVSMGTDSSSQEEESEEEEEDDEGEEDIDVVEGSPSDILPQHRYPARSARSSKLSPALSASNYKTSTHNVRSSSSRTSPRSSAWQCGPPRQDQVSPESYRQTRKRRHSPVQTPPRRTEVPRKRMKQITPAAGSPRPRYAYISSDSELEEERPAKRRHSPRISSPPEPVKSPKQMKSLSARTIRQAARRAATQIVETSWKIMQDAKAAAKKIRGSASKRRSSAVDDGVEITTAVKPESSERRGKRAGNRDGSSDSGSEPAVSTRSRRSGLKRKASSPEESPPAESQRLRHRESPPDFVTSRDVARAEALASSQEVRKNGGLNRKFTRTQDARGEGSDAQASMQPPAVPLSASQRSGPFSVPASGTAGENRAATITRSASERANPLSNVLLVPTASRPAPWGNGAVTDSADSITHELDPSSQYRSTNLIFNNPFSSLLEPSTSSTPHPVTFTSGSVWARVNMRSNQTQASQQAETNQNSESRAPAPEPSGQRMATRSSPQTESQAPVLERGEQRSSPQTESQIPTLQPSRQRIATRSSPQTVASGQQSVNTGSQPSTSTSKAAGSSSQETARSPERQATPRVPSLTLTGQFAMSGRFAFLLQDVLQVTVTTGDITNSTTNAIVISTDRQLRHQNPVARSVASAAGPGFAVACQNFLHHRDNGLQDCEVLDTPAGGRLPKQTSNVLMVVVPGADKPKEAGDFSKQRKMLLCTFVNCLKHASEKLKLQTIAFPLVGAGTYPADECIQVFFDSLLVYLVERTSACPLHGIQLIVNSPAISRFAAEVLEARLEALVMEGVDSAVASVFRDYFNVPDFVRMSSSSSPQTVERNSSGKPAVKRRRL